MSNNNRMLNGTSSSLVASSSSSSVANNVSGPSKLNLNFEDEDIEESVKSVADILILSDDEEEEDVEEDVNVDVEEEEDDDDNDSIIDYNSMDSPFSTRVDSPSISSIASTVTPGFNVQRGIIGGGSNRGVRRRKRGRGRGINMKRKKNSSMYYDDNCGGFGGGYGFGDGGIRYRLSCIQREDHKDILGVSFNHFVRKCCDNVDVFATCGDHFISAYECINDVCSDEAGAVRCLASYFVEDEQFYCCSWSFDTVKTGNPFLIGAGLLGVIRIIDLVTVECVKLYQGHGGPINDIKICQHKPQLMLTCSKDQSIRLWNIKTDVCVAIFGGCDGHRDQVVSCDFHRSLPLFVSCGIDHQIKIWSLDTPEIKKATLESESFCGNINEYSFPTECKNYPLFSTREIHHNYVDCVQWFGDLLISKSCENEVICWKPGRADDQLVDLPFINRPNNNNINDQTNGASCSSSTSSLTSSGCSTSSATTNSIESNVTIIQKFSISNCSVWYIRFGMNQQQTTLAVGNMEGSIFVWNMDVEDPTTIHQRILKQKYCRSTIRQVSFNFDGTILVAVTENANVIRFDLNGGTSTTATSIKVNGFGGNPMNKSRTLSNYPTTTTTMVSNGLIRPAINGIEIEMENNNINIIKDNNNVDDDDDKDSETMKLELNNITSR